MEKSGKKKILLVDDDKFVLGFMKFTLSSAGYDVVGLEEGTNVIKRAKEEQPDLVILDVLIPGMDGFKITEKIKGEPDLANMKVIISSAIYKKESYIEEAKRMGADDYLIKPINKPKLLEAVQSLIGAP